MVNGLEQDEKNEIVDIFIYKTAGELRIKLETDERYNCKWDKEAQKKGGKWCQQIEKWKIQLSRKDGKAAH